MEDIDKWIRQNALAGVCELDIDARTMRPIAPGCSVRLQPERS